MRDRRRCFCAAAALVLAAGSALPVAAADGDADVESGVFSAMELPWVYYQEHNVGRLVLTQADGGIVVVQTAFDATSVFLQRVSPMGQIDPFFYFEDTFGDDQIYPIAGFVLPDGRIFFAAQRDLFGVRTLVAWRLLPDGFPDISFDGDGRLELDLPLDKDNIRAAIPGPGGTILIGADGEHTTSFGTLVKLCVTRLREDGSLDTNWTLTGSVVRNWRATSHEDDNSRLGAIALDGGGILISGYLQNATLNTDKAVAGRLDAAGNFDTLWGSSGRIFLDWSVAGDPARNHWSFGLARLADGSAVVAGSFTDLAVTEYRFGLVRLTPFGGLDSTYGSEGTGYVHGDFGAGGYGLALYFLLDRAGDAVVAGDWLGSGVLDYGVARFLPTGLPDLHFQGDGNGTYGYTGGSYDDLRGLTLAPDGGIILLGSAPYYDTEGDPYTTAQLIRLQGGMPFTADFESDSFVFWDEAVD